MKVFADYHTHTTYSHGRGSVLDNVAAAARRGLEIIAISDHGPNHMWGIGITNIDILDQIRHDVTVAMRQCPSVKALVGIEANITSIEGDIDVSHQALSKLDILQVGLHLMVRSEDVLDGLIRIGSHLVRGLSKRARETSRYLNTQALVNAVYKHNIDAITHPGHRLLIDTKRLAQACAATDTAFEINTSHSHITCDLIKLVARQGCNFVIGSDAHTPDRVGDFARGIELAKQAGVTVDRICNARYDS